MAIHQVIEVATAGLVTGHVPVYNATTGAFDPAAQPAVVATSVSAYDIDWSAGRVFTKVLGAGAQTFTFSNATDGQTIIVLVTGSASTLTWPTIKWPAGVAPTQTAAGKDIYTLTMVGATIYGYVSQAMA